MRGECIPLRLPEVGGGKKREKDCTITEKLKKTGKSKTAEGTKCLPF